MPKKKSGRQILLAIMDALKLQSRAEVAALMGARSPTAVSHIMRPVGGRSLTADQALQLFQNAGISPEFALHGTGPMFAVPTQGMDRDAALELLLSPEVRRVVAAAEKNPELLRVFLALIDEQGGGSSPPGKRLPRK